MSTSFIYSSLVKGSLCCVDHDEEHLLEAIIVLVNFFMDIYNVVTVVVDDDNHSTLTYQCSLLKLGKINDFVLKFILNYYFFGS